MEKMIEETETELEQCDIPITEESLISDENLDRASPDLWPDSNMTKFTTQNSPQTETPAWSANITQEDLNQMYHLGRMTVNELISEVKKLHDSAYQLGLEEAKEMTRGKYLNIFKQK